jgi:hypothetical protein
MRGLWPELHPVLVAIVLVVTIAALVFWIMGAAPSIG